MSQSELLLQIQDIIEKLNPMFSECESIALPNLPQFSAWPARLLGLDFFEQKVKSKENILKEYDQTKWGKLLQDFHKYNWQTFEEFHKFVFQDIGIVPVYWKGNLLLVDLEKERILEAELLSQVIELFGLDKTIVELGCGYGEILFSLAKQDKYKNIEFIGCELTKSGIELTRMIAERYGFAVKTDFFDFEDESTVQDNIPKDALIYTAFSTVMIPELSQGLIERLIAYHPKAVIHLEPIYPQNNTDNLLSLMIKRYMQVNDYNTNLMKLLRKAEEKGMIKILVATDPILGGNPLLPASLIIWQPC